MRVYRLGVLGTCADQIFEVIDTQWSSSHKLGWLLRYAHRAVLPTACRPRVFVYAHTCV